MSDIYDGPAALVTDDGTEIPVQAHLDVTVEPAWGDADPFDRYEPGPRSWIGVLEAQVSLPGDCFTIPRTLRFPDGREGTLISVTGEFATPNRVEIEGGGSPPWQ